MTPRVMVLLLCRISASFMSNLVILVQHSFFRISITAQSCKCSLNNVIILLGSLLMRYVKFDTLYICKSHGYNIKKFLLGRLIVAFATSLLPPPGRVEGCPKQKKF